MTLFGRRLKTRDLAAVITWAVVSGITLYIVQYGGGQYEGLVVKVAVLQLVYLGAMIVLFRCENNRLLALTFMPMPVTSSFWALRQKSRLLWHMKSWFICVTPSSATMTAR